MAQVPVRPRCRVYGDSGLLVEFEDGRRQPVAAADVLTTLGGGGPAPTTTDPSGAGPSAVP